MNANKTAPLKKKSCKPSRRGQAMVEYSIVMHFVLLGGTLLMLTVIGDLYDALTTFYDSIYFVLNTAAV